MPFEDRADLLDHFADHGQEVGANTAADYERLADNFMFGPRGPDVEECIRPQGGFVRFDKVTQEYGAVNSRGFVSTYFIADPNVHREASNLAYFRKRCR